MLFNKLLKIIIGFLLIYRIDGRPSNGTFQRNKLEENPDLFEGDMRFPDSSQRGVLRRGSSVAWTNGIVPYEISSDYDSTNRSLIISTMQKMERLIAVNNVQCIHFQPRISSDQYYITIEDGFGCSSYVGQNSRHIVTLKIPGCMNEGIIMHELLHTLGFYHEQSRPDRDNYIEVNHANIQFGMEHNFEKYDSNTVDTQSTPYDYGSLMHYDSHSFSFNGHPTITPKRAGVKIGQRYHMSTIDIQEVRLFYNCSSMGNTFPPISTTTPTSNLYGVNTTISSSLTTNSSMYNREYHVNQYYYESFEIKATVSGYYIFTSNSSIDTYSYFYKTSFDPYDQSSNLVTYDDDASGSDQFQFKEYLEANKIYILVFTTYSSLATGNYTLIVSGLNSVQITKLPSISVTTTTTATTRTTRSQRVSIYSSVLTNNSLTFTRYESSGTYYYHSILITVYTSGNYSIQSNASFDTYGYLYWNSFNPKDTSQNILKFDDDRAGNGQFLLEYTLESYNSYILVVTTFSSNITGPFSITVSGPSITTLTSLNNSTTTGHIYSVNTTRTSSLTTSSAVYDRSGSFSQRYYYETYEIRVPIDNYYIIKSVSSIDTYGYLYQTSFNPYNPSSNLITSNDDAGGSNQFQFTIYLQANKIYILVFTTYSSSVTGNYALMVSGSHAVRITKLPSISVPIPILTKYSSLLTSNSLMFTRYGSSGTYYYHSISITVYTSGNYSIRSNASIDTYGYLYSYAFDPKYISHNLLKYDDDSAGNRQFLLEYTLESYSRYILVVTTHSSYMTGRFSITVSGPSSVTLVSNDHSSSSSSTKPSNNFGVIFLVAYIYFYA